MTPKIYGHGSSTCTQRVLVVAKELGIPVYVVPVDHASLKTPEFLKIHPFGQVPYMDDDGFILYESRAIARYLCVKYGNKKLIPQDIQANALFEQAASIEQSNFDSQAIVILKEQYVAASRGEEPDAQLLAKYRETFEKNLDGYETILAKQKYLAGNELTLVDLFHLSLGVRFAVMPQPQLNWPFVVEARPNLARWWKELTSLPSWKAVEAEAQEATAVMAKTS